MSKLRTFKAQKGKVLFCKSGDIIFKDGFFATNDPVELESISNGVGIEEVTGTKEEKAKKSSKKIAVPNKQDAKKEAEEKEKKEAEEKAKELEESQKASDDQDVALEDMKVDQMKEYLDSREVDYADDISEDALREIVRTEAENELHAADISLKDDEDIDSMPKPRCKEVLSHAGIAFDDNAGVADLRELVLKLK